MRSVKPKLGKRARQVLNKLKDRDSGKENGKRQGRIHLTPQVALSTEVLSEKRNLFLQAWSDPFDTREEKEIAEELGVDLYQLRTWRLDPSFYTVATDRFRSAFHANLIPIFRNLITQAVKYGSIQASRVLLEIHGILKGNGDTNVNIFSGGNSGGYSVNLSDDELEQEIVRLEQEVYPRELKYKGRKIRPTKEIVVEEIQ